MNEPESSLEHDAGTRHDLASLQHQSTVEDKVLRPNRSIAFLTATRWLVWLVAVATDILIAIRQEMWPGILFIKS